MELRLLEYFLAIDAAGSISQAAQRLHITQPTLSRQLKGLENELGTPLFARSNHGLTLTQAGLYLKTRAQEILTLTAQTEQTFIDQRHDLFSGNINIGAVEADGSHMLANEIAAFTTEYPAVTFDLFTGTSDDLFDRLDKGLIDLGLLLEPVNTDKYDHLTLAHTERWGLVVSVDAPLATQPVIAPNALADIPLIISSRNAVQQLFSDWAQADIDRLNIVGHFNLIFNVLPLVRRQVGAALTIEGVIDPHDHAGVRFIPFSPRVQTHTVLAWRKHRLQTPVTTAFIERFTPYRQ
ncbi:LysR family transcriptional regulator [Lacticaseibacillus baoqingensis]|uniref:LysR family transcriptional regulator n=1 Tax=Lacticaseibacillus baoqingensis TaxID=2486013 RepID=A0ABW4E7Q8_9LACO|nr:LysR family transcriptional regulator [Lacticaseibacillus baoqingensis]